jgi:transcriptional regulator with XRE-family HTH domain
MSRRRSGYDEKKFSGEYLGPRIREYRMGCGMSVVKLANEVGVLPNYISQLENGDKIPSLDTFIRIADALHVTADALLCDYLLTQSHVVETKLSRKISELSKEDQLHIENVLNMEINYIKSVKK